MEAIIKSLLQIHKLTEKEWRKVYRNSTDEYERRLLSMLSRLTNLYVLEYQKDVEVSKDGGQLLVSFIRYKNEQPERINVIHFRDVNEYTILFEDLNSVTYINPLYVEKTIREFYGG